ncbi:TPA_asm: L [Panicum betacytorhabdovirus 1]|nr:TPA_asm: L [Panicum betacytorhabdovirus 1]
MADLDPFDELRKPMKGLGDFHLRSALVPIDISSLLQGKGRWRERNAFSRLRQYFHEISAGDPAILLSEIMSIAQYERPQPLPLLDETVDLLEMEIEGLEFLSSPGDPLYCAVKLIKDVRTRPTSRMFGCKILFQRALMCMNAMTSARDYSLFELPSDVSGFPRVDIGMLRLLLAGDLFGSIVGEGVLEIYSLDVFRMIVDKLTERDNVIVASFIGRRIFPQVYPEPSDLHDIFKIFDEWLMRKGNSGYSLLKTFEALTTGVLLAYERSSFTDNELFLRNTLLGLDDDSRQVALEYITKLRSIRGATPHHLTQIMGLFRLWGHPVVNSKKGMEKVRLIGTKPKTISKYVAKTAGRKLKEIFMLEYYRSRHQYPEFSVIDEDNWVVPNLHTQLPINTSDPRYHLSDWDAIEIERTFVAPSTFNLSMIVSDTAISPTRQELYDCLKEGKPVTDPMVRRGVLKWMKDGVINCDELLGEVDRSPLGLDKSNRVIGLYPKEREMNPVARMFALMSLKMRSYIVVTENMLSENVLRYIPGVTMTYNLLDLAKEMIHSTSSQRQQGASSRTFCINMDFEKWNLNMRRESTEYVFENLGRMFGLPTLFNKTYDIFQNSLIYLADGSYSPKIDANLDNLEIDPDLAYTNHIGGFEGLRQKGWTIFTVVLIAYVCDELGISYKLMGQGDNQVLMVTIHSQHAKLSGLESPGSVNEITSTLAKLQRKLIEVFGDVGLPLKPLETWVSDPFFSYGKFPIYKGVPLSSSLKRISRIFYFSNEDLMTVDNALGAVTANSQSAAMADVHPAVPYLIAKWQQLQCLNVFSKYHPLVGGPPSTLGDPFAFSMRTKSGEYLKFHGEPISDQRSLIKVLASVPKTLGGLNIITYFDMIMRGFSDPPCKVYQWLCMITQHAKEDIKQYLTNWKNLLLSETIDYLHLLQDPTAINIFSPPNSNTIIKRMIQQTISRLPKDSEFAVWFQELIGISAEKDVEVIVQKLTSTDEINVRLCHDVLGSTLFGYADSIASKVDKTVTLSRMTVGREDVIEALVMGEKRRWNYLGWRSTCTAGEQPSSSCPSESIRNYRDKGWGKKISGISTPFPFHFITRDESSTDRADSFVEVVISDYAVGSKNALVNTAGSSLPYLGSVTKEKLQSSATRAAYGTEPLIARPVRLLRAIGWFIPENSNWSETLQNLLGSVSDLDPSVIISIPEHVKGSMAHRYLDFILKHGSLWMALFGAPSHLSMSTNSFTEYAKGSKNVTLHFQALLCLIQFASLNINMSAYPKKVMRFYRGCKHCITPVDEPNQDLPASIAKEEFPSKPQNPYLYIGKDDIALIYSQTTNLFEEIPKLGKEGMMKEIGLSRALLTEVLACKAAQSIMRRDQSRPDAGLSDIGGVSRTVFLKLNIQSTFIATLKFIWIGSASSDVVLDSGSYPSWAYMKRSIIRKLWETPLSAFTLLTGFYLWEEIMNEMKLIPWVVMPLSYPITPSSLGTAVKNSLIRLAERLVKFRSPGTKLITPLITMNFGMILKHQLLFYRGSLKASCPDCVVSGMTSKLTQKAEWKSLEDIKCKSGHNVFSLNDWKGLRRVLLDVETLGDLVPTLPRQSRRLTNTVIVPSEINQWNEVFSTKSSKSYADNATQLPGDAVIRGINLIVNMELKFSLPTKSLYRVHEALSYLDDIMEYGGILCLGDGYGYSSMAAKMIAPGAKVFSWTLIDTSMSVQHCLRLSRPPTHYRLDVGVNSSLTIDKVSNVFSAKFLEELQGVVKDHRIDLLVSEIEYRYSGTTDDPEYMMRIFHASMVPRAMIKIELNGLEIVNQYINSAIKRYSVVEVFETSTCGLHTGDLWLYIDVIREDVQESRYLDQNSTIRLYQELRVSSSREDNWDISGSTKSINKNLSKTALVTDMQIMLDIWFQDGHLIHWREEDFSRLYYGIKTGRRPREILDKTGHGVYYLHFDQSQKMFIRLMTLVLSLMDNRYTISQILNSAEDKWTMKWRKQGVHGGSRQNYQWSPELIKVKHENRFWNKAAIAEIKRYLPPVKQMRPPNYRSVNDVPDRIRFLYVKRDAKTMPLCFPISKLSSFTVAR